MKKIEFGGHIVDGEMSYDIPLEEMQDKIKKFKDKNEQLEFIWSLEIVDKARHYQHKYYWGFLLPDVADALGERDKTYVHYMILKKKFLYNKYEGFDKIPAKYRSRAFIYNYEVVNIDGEFIRTDIVGWAPSTGDISYDEEAEYLKCVEEFLLVECEGHLGQSGGGKYEKKQAQAISARDKIIEAHCAKLGTPAIAEELKSQGEMFEW